MRFGRETQRPLADLDPGESRQPRAIDLGLGAGNARGIGRLIEQRERLRRGPARGGLPGEAVERLPRAPFGQKLAGEARHALRRRVEQDGAGEIAPRLGVTAETGQALPHGVVEGGAMPAIIVARLDELVLHHLALAAGGHEHGGIELRGEGERAPGLGERGFGLALDLPQRLGGQALRLRGSGRGEQDQDGESRRHGLARGRSRARRACASASVSSFLQNAKRTWRLPEAGSR